MEPEENRNPKSNLNKPIDSQEPVDAELTIHDFHALANDFSIGGLRHEDLDETTTKDIPQSSDQQKKYIGRYQIERVLGRGGFGIVYLAHDNQLDRGVAIKLPHLHRLKTESSRRLYLQEAKTLAKLDHPSIVPVYDYGVIRDGRCFVVSKFIDGQDLAGAIAEGNLSFPRTAEILQAAASALHYVHQARIVHRDIKPSNLLLGKDGRVYVADFGLAMQEDLLDPKASIAGSPSFMSPEQSRGEGHRIDGRSDQFSLGCIMYEMLTGVRAFSGGSIHETLEKIRTVDPRPPREINPNIPAELERICLKLLSKLASQRYIITHDLAEDLQEWRRHKNDSTQSIQIENSTASIMAAQAVQGKTITVVPRGLRAFTRDDAYFFLRLLPGTRDRNGLPLSISHWVNWMHAQSDRIDGGRVGVISGPTGCGKSSLVRAGLIPQLDRAMTKVMIEATPDLTESQLLASICSKLGISFDGSLASLLAEIRRGKTVDPEDRLLIVIDQFEQWLHVHPDPQETELANAIRQCDGDRIRCLLLVRDDFWLALSRFMEAIESPIVLGQNAVMVDLFEQRHAHQVLIEFGRAYGRLPDDPTPPTREQERFLEQVLANLAVDGKFIPVHLSLFAEMVKSRDWVQGTLKQMGGTVGVGQQFLNEAFSVSYAPAHQRAHDVAAKSVLQVLLPDARSEIKASRKLRSELLAASGYQDTPAKFDALMNILENDLKLISAADSNDSKGSMSHESSLVNSTYQLSHDFLVPSIREWLSAKQRETFQGRLHARLSEQAQIWNSHREANFLPSFFSWLLYRLFIPRSTLSAQESELLRTTDRQAYTMLAIGAVTLAAMLFGAFDIRNRMQSDNLVDQLSTASMATAPSLLEQAARSNDRVRQGITRTLADQTPGSESWLILQMAKLKWSQDSFDEFFEHALDAPIEFVPAIQQSMIPLAKLASEKCRNVLREDHAIASALETKESNQRNGREEVITAIIDDHTFRAIQFLSVLPPSSDASPAEDWKLTSPMICNKLIETCKDHPDKFGTLAKSLSSLSEFLIPHLRKFVGVEQEDINSRLAISLLMDYTKGDPKQQTQQFLDSSTWQWNVLLPPASQLDMDILRQSTQTVAPQSVSVASWVSIEHRRALAAALLLANSEPSQTDDLWSLLRRTAQPEARSSLIHFLAPANVPAQLVIQRLRRESDPGIVSALIMALGEYPTKDTFEIPSTRVLIVDLYQNDPDAGVHGAAEWLLRRWDDSKSLESLAYDSPSIVANSPKPPRRWIHTPSKLTLSLVDAADDPAIRRNFLIATKEVTWKEYHDFQPHAMRLESVFPSEDCPVGSVTWPDALEYCNWLSKQAGFPESEYCYPTDRETLQSWIPDREHLERTGFRLPTPEEWIYACRAGTKSSRFFGDGNDLIGFYCWYDRNSTVIDPITQEYEYRVFPVGLRKPNELGLFDQYGNIVEWCDGTPNNTTSERSSCGGGTISTASRIKSDDAASWPTLTNFRSIGFRVARTVRK